MLDKVLNAIGKFAYRCRYVILAIGVLLFVGVAILQSYARVVYSYSDYSKVTETFPKEDTLVLVYDNFDEEKIQELIIELSQDEYVTSIQSYSTTLGMKMDSAQLAEIAGIDEAFIDVLFYIHEHGIDTDGMTVQTFVNFLTSDMVLGNELFAGQMPADSVSQLMQLKTIVNATATNQVYDAKTLADVLGVDVSLVRAIFLFSFKLEMTIDEFIDSALTMASAFSKVVEIEQLADLQMMDRIVENVKTNVTLSPAELLSVFPLESESFNEDTLKLLYVMYYASATDVSEVKLPLYDFFNFIAEEIVPNELFSAYFDESMKAQIIDAKRQMEEGKAQLVGEQYSRAVITLDYEMESEAMYDFYKTLEQKLAERLDGIYYFVGESAMSSELSKTFEKEYAIISIITAVAIFIVVYLTFKNATISLILISIIECAVFITMSTMVLSNSSMYFMALIIVQCILMGSMVDYGILFTNYYIEVRKEHPVQTALPEVLKRSIRAIAMSAVILILITFICGRVMKGAVSSILTTLCVGSTSALILVIFVLPSLLAIFDKQILKLKKKEKYNA